MVATDWQGLQRALTGSQGVSRPHSSTFPGDRIIDVDEVDIPLVPGRHPAELLNEQLINELWVREKAANPALYDGRVLMPFRLALQARRLVGTCYRTRFAAVTYWIRNTHLDDCPLAYANAMLVTSDNALVAVEMAKHTLNAGFVYFASGGFDEEDVRDGQLDVWGNMCRETLEETGLQIGGLPRDPGFRVLSAPNGLAITTRVFLSLTAAEAEERIRDFLAKEREPEIRGPVIIRDTLIPDVAFAPQMLPLINWHFATPRIGL
jgi:8-oxo-dGTP pyrophosphatase MutT (NUDIX family)